MTVVRLYGDPFVGTWKTIDAKTIEIIAGFDGDEPTPQKFTLDNGDLVAENGGEKMIFKR